MNAVNKLLNFDYADLQVGRDCNNKIMVKYDHGCWVKDGYFLSGSCGRGNTFEEACADYLNIISGKTLVFNPNTEEEVRLQVL